MNDFYLRFTIPVPPRTKKNHQRIIWNKARKAPMIMPSPQYKAYEEECSVYIPRRKQPIDFPVTIQALFFMPTRRKVDLLNAAQALADIMVKYRLLADDDCTIIVDWDGSGVFYDKQNPRTEVIIRSATATFEGVKDAKEKKK